MSILYVSVHFFSEFESSEKKRIQEELESFNRELDEDMVREQDKHKRNVEQLNKRKEDMIREKKNKMKVRGEKQDRQ